MHALLTACVKAQCESVPIRIFQGGAHLGTGNPVATAQNVQDFYGYDGNSFTGPLPVAGQRSLVTIHQDSTTCELSLVIVHSKPHEGPFYSGLEMYVNGDLHDPLVKDDAMFTEIVLHVSL